MRRYLTIGITKAGKVDVLHGAEKGYSVHRDEFVKLASGKKKGKAAAGGYAEVQVIDVSRGVVKRRRFDFVRVKGLEESGKSTIARTVKHGKKSTKTVEKKKPAGKSKKTAPKGKASTPAKKRMRELTKEKAPAKPAAKPEAKHDASPTPEKAPEAS